MLNARGFVPRRVLKKLSGPQPAPRREASFLPEDILKPILTAAGCAALLLLAQAPAALAQSQPTSEARPAAAPVLNLSAQGEVRVAPDLATISLGVTEQALTAQEAMQRNASRMNQVIASLRKAGIAERDIQTSNLSLNPQYVYEENKPPRLTGYQASNQVTIRVLDLKRLGEAVDATVSAGANQIGSISFGLRDPSAAENAARREAVRALAAKAELYASATGHKVARLVSLSEGGGYVPQPPMPMPMMAVRMEKAMDSTPVAAGELSVRIDINGVYEMSR